MVSAYHKYIARCQYLLSQGKPVADILYITPEGAPQVFLPPASALEGTAFMPDKKSFSFDGCSPMYFMKYASVKNKMTVFPGGASYKLVILPDIKTFTPEFAAKIDSLISAGATVIGNPPMKSPSLSGYPECDQELREITERVWGTNKIQAGVTSRQYGMGRIISGRQIYPDKSMEQGMTDSLALYPDYKFTEDILKENGFRPDFVSGGKIRYTHRSLPDAEIYFISNRTGSISVDTCIFRDGTENAELWDAVTGDIYSVKTVINLEGMISLPVTMEPYQSYFIVFKNSEKADEGEPLKLNTFAAGKIVTTLDGKWNVAFDTAWGGPSEIVFDELSDWSERPEEGIKYYSGIAKYSKEFDFPEYPEFRSSEMFLNLGSVRNLARVNLNGRDLGVLWTSPWKLRVTDCIKKTGNKLKIEVANLWINRLIGDEMKPFDGIENGKWPDWLINGKPRTSGRYTFTTHHYYKKGDQLSESGLLGPVRIETISRPGR
jgi:hypothetical protein